MTAEPVLSEQQIPAEVAEELSFVVDSLDDSGQPIVFTSPRPRAGTSTVALAAARSLATNRGQRVLLVDCDYRTPGHQDLRQFRNGAGLTQCIADGGRFGIRETAVENLSVLPPGAPPDSPHRLFESAEFDRTMAGLTQSYKYVLIDAPPVLSYSEVLPLCRRGYPIVLVIDATSTRAGTVIEAKRRIANAKGEIAYAILNRRPYYLPSFLYRTL